MRDLHNGATRCIMKLASVVRTTLDSFVDGSVVTPMEARALLFVATAKEDICQKDIEREYGLSRATVSELMQSMEQKGMIVRRRSALDRRRNCIAVCEAFRPMVTAMIEEMNGVEDALAADIPEEDVEVFLRVIRTMAENARPQHRGHPWEG